MRDVAAIVSVGMFTPVGLNARQTVASIRSGITRISEVPIYDQYFEKIMMGHLPDDVLPVLKEDFGTNIAGLYKRLLQIAAPALREVTSGLHLSQSVPLFLAAPKPQNGFSLEKTPFFENLEGQTKAYIDVKASRLFPMGRAGFFLSLQKAIHECINATFTKYVIVGGVDSYFDMDVLFALEKEGRLLREGVYDGFRPGEGAAMMLLTTLKECRTYGLKPLAYICGVGQGQEEGHRYSEKPYLGEGLAQAFADLFSGTQDKLARIQTVFAGLNGENFNAKEWGVAYLRNRERFIEDFQIEHPAEFIGDAGAALAPIMTATAAVGLQKGFIKGPALVWASSDEAERGAACLTTILP
jgi:3-oxoacyl-[acyl-carrier-protein] synthase I